jgi:hypothetical protein
LSSGTEMALLSTGQVGCLDIHSMMQSKQATNDVSSHTGPSSEKYIQEVSAPDP